MKALLGTLLSTLSTLLEMFSFYALVIVCLFESGGRGELEGFPGAALLEHWARGGDVVLRNRGLLLLSPADVADYE